MKHLYSAFLILALSLAGALPSFALSKNVFASRSVLAEGKWVKVGVTKTGVYEISYDMLRHMGFKNPEKVAIYGRGGRMMSENFTSSSQAVLVYDDIKPTPVLHQGEKVYFYGLGVEDIDFKAAVDYNTRGYFQRKSRNIYSNRGYYFLTDSTLPLSLSSVASDDAASLADAGALVSYVYHEKDLFQNNSKTGRLFWGERIGLPGPGSMEWDVNLPNAIPNSGGAMHCELYAQRDLNAVCQYGMVGGEKVAKFQSLVSKTTVYFYPQNPRVSPVSITGPKGKVFVSMGNTNYAEVANLDFWVLTYQAAAPTLVDADGKHFNQSLMACPQVTKNQKKRLTIPDAATVNVWDVTNGESPRQLVVTRQGNDGTVKVVNDFIGTRTPLVCMFDTSMPQLQISGYQEAYSMVENQNLHAAAKEGADLLIICIPRLREYAEEIAEIHREKEGLKVMVATTEECYNEFSAGLPDPMAYRTLAKMLYSGTTQLKNVLLMGPLHADFRGINAEKDPLAGIIAVQSSLTSLDKGAQNANDFIGMMDDYLRELDYIEKMPMQVGVGILPCHFDSEARIAVDKIRSFYEDDYFAYTLNTVMNVGGILDRQSHSTQAVRIAEHMDSLNRGSSLYHPLILDAYGHKVSRKKFFANFENGLIIMNYFGHGAEGYLGKDREFFNAPDIYRLSNRHLPFVAFAGCSLSNSDRGLRGLGETIVTATPYGALASFLATRETWSGQNMDLFTKLYRAFYCTSGSSSAQKLTEPLTLGEVVAHAKTASDFNNELAYQLVGDPAIKLPVATRAVAIDTPTPSARPGQPLRIKGHILNAQGQPDFSWNGHIVARLNQPLERLTAKNIETNDTAKITVPYADRQLAMAASEVRNGIFEFDIHVPSSAAVFNGSTGFLHLASFDRNSRIGAASKFEPLFCKDDENGDDTAESRDTSAPLITEFRFDPNECALIFEATDDTAIDMSAAPLSRGMILYLDGKEYASGYNTLPIMSDGQRSILKHVPIYGLTYGSHSAHLRIKDVAGNIAEQEILFVYAPTESKFTLSMQEKAVHDKATLTLEGEIYDGAHLVVLDSFGNEIYSSPITGAEIEWPCVDASGRRVLPGLYRAYVIERGSRTGKAHSSSVDIPVI